MLHLLDPPPDDPRVSVYFRIKDAINRNTRHRHGALGSEPAEDEAEEPPFLSWPPPGLGRLQGDLWQIIKETGLGSLPLVLPRALDARPAFDELLAYHEAPGPFPEARLRGLLLALATACFAIADEPAAGEGLQAHQRRHLQRFLAEHLHQPIGPADLAAELDLSLDYFSRRFRHSYGVPPRRFLVEERMRAAALRLTESEDPVCEVGRYVGVADPNLFSRQFRRVMGCTPGTYRRRGHAPEHRTEGPLDY